MDHGYTYTTLTGRPGEAMRVDTAFYLDENAHIRVVGAGRDRAFLAIDHGEVSVIIGPRVNVRLTTDDVALIRRLAEESARLLAEVERIRADQISQAETAA